MAFWRTKAAISLKCVKMEEKLLWRAYRNSPMLFQTVPSPTPSGLPFLEIGGLQLSYPLISGTGKATDFKFGGYIYRANPNKSPLKILEKRERERIQGLPIFLVPPVISGTGKAMDFKFCKNIHRVDRNKPMKNVGNSSRGHSQGVRKIFRAPMYRAHCTVIFEIAQLSYNFILCTTG